MTAPNQTASGNGAITFLFHAQRLRRAVPEPIRWSLMIARLFFLLLVVASSALAQTNAVTPTNFVLQVLEPTGGKIQRPKDWFYREGHRGPTYMWTISREDSSKTYTTGVRIQTFVNVKKGTGKTPKEFVEDFVIKKKKVADKVVKSCGESKQQLFTRICVETEEGPHHILYSLFWGNDDLDVVVVSIAGTTKELWEIYSPVFDKMADFELIDMKRFEK